jgi:hypothetical protein
MRRCVGDQRQRLRFSGCELAVARESVLVIAGVARTGRATLRSSGSAYGWK